MYSYLPTKDADLEDWVGNFLTVAAANETALGIAAADLAPITADNTAYVNAIASVTTTKTAAKAATHSKDVAHKTLTHDVRLLVKRIQAHPGVSSTLKVSLGINPDNGTRTTTPPVTPKDLKANGSSLGVNSIAWNKNGNIPTTQFVIEAKKPADTTWNIVGQTTRSKFDHTGQTPGVKLEYRIIAARADKASVPSLSVTVY